MAETKKETPEEKIVREAAALKDANTAPAAKQPVEKQAKSKKEEKTFEGQVIQSDHFNIVTGDVLGRPLVSVAPVGFVGDAPLVIPGWKVLDLIKSLQKISSVPDEPDAPKTNPASTGSDPE